jgi:hypothetical protein
MVAGVRRAASRTLQMCQPSNPMITWRVIGMYPPAAIESFCKRVGSLRVQLKRNHELKYGNTAREDLQCSKE